MEYSITVLFHFQKYSLALEALRRYRDSDYKATSVYTSDDAKAILLPDSKRKHDASRAALAYKILNPLSACQISLGPIMIFFCG